MLVVGTYLGVQSWEGAELRCTLRVVSLGSSISPHLSTAARQGGRVGRGRGMGEGREVWVIIEVRAENRLLHGLYTETERSGVKK